MRSVGFIRNGRLASNGISENYGVWIETLNTNEHKAYDTLNELLEDKIHTASPCTDFFEMRRHSASIAKISRRGMGQTLIGPPKSLFTPPRLIRHVMDAQPDMAVRTEPSIIHWYLCYEGTHPSDGPFQKIAGKYYAHPDIHQLILRLSL